MTQQEDTPGKQRLLLKNWTLVSGLSVLYYKYPKHNIVNGRIFIIGKSLSKLIRFRERRLHLSRFSRRKLPQFPNNSVICSLLLQKKIIRRSHPPFALSLTEGLALNGPVFKKIDIQFLTQQIYRFSEIIFTLFVSSILLSAGNRISYNR